MVVANGFGLRVAWAASVVLVCALTLATVGGLLIDGAYDVVDPMVAMLRGYDLVTLVVAVPALVVGLVGSLRGSVRAQLVWASGLAFVVYTYALYVFVMPSGSLFLLHVGLFLLSLLGFVLVLGYLDLAALVRGLSPRIPKRWIAVLLGVVAGIGVCWAAYSIGFGGARLPEAGPLFSYVLDLALLAPSCVLAGVLLWRRAVWGYVLATVLLMSGFVLHLAYVSAVVSQAVADVPGEGMGLVEPVIAVGFGVGAVLLFRGLAPVGARDASRATGRHGQHRPRRADEDQPDQTWRGGYSPT